MARTALKARVLSMRGMCVQSRVQRSPVQRSEVLVLKEPPDLVCCMDQRLAHYLYLRAPEIQGTRPKCPPTCSTWPRVSTATDCAERDVAHASTGRGACDIVVRRTGSVGEACMRRSLAPVALVPAADVRAHWVPVVGAVSFVIDKFILSTMYVENWHWPLRVTNEMLTRLHSWIGVICKDPRHGSYCSKNITGLTSQPIAHKAKILQIIPPLCVLWHWDLPAVAKSCAEHPLVVY